MELAFISAFVLGAWAANAIGDRIMPPGVGEYITLGTILVWITWLVILFVALVI